MNKIENTEIANYLSVIEDRINTLMPNVIDWHITPNQQLWGDNWIVNRSRGNAASVYISKELFDDLHDNQHGPSSEYTKHLINRLDKQIIEARDA